MKTNVIAALAVLSLVTGATTLVLGSRYIERMREDGDGPFGSGSAEVVDRAYLAVPPDAKAGWLNDFTLTERSGKQVRWSDLRGKVAVTSFFFSACPSICLQQNHKVREIQRSFAGQDVAFVSITCDPEIDSPERLREYASKLEADPKQWLFLTGELAYIRRVAAELFTVPLDKQTHTEKLLVSDKWGNPRGAFGWKKLNEVTQLKVLVEKLLAETEEPAEFQKKKAEAAAAKAQAEAEAAAATDSEAPSDVQQPEAADTTP
jgi:cytochrome oxidase Cu insertion factor (SCO1/SenC/PrrC family)